MPKDRQRTTTGSVRTGGQGFLEATEMKTCTNTGPHTLSPNSESNGLMSGKFTREEQGTRWCVPIKISHVEGVGTKNSLCWEGLITCKHKQRFGTQQPGPVQRLHFHSKSSIELVQMSKDERSSLQRQLEPKACNLLNYKLSSFIFMFYSCFQFP